MFSLDCSYYKGQFTSLSELLEDVIRTGMDPEFEITRNGTGTGERAIDYLSF